MPGTNLFSTYTANVGGIVVHSCLTDENGLLVFGKCEGLPPTSAAGFFAPGCILNDISSQNLRTFQNIGTADGPFWGLMTTYVFSISQKTNGITPVDIFDSGSTPADFQITNIFVVSQDATPANITVSSNAVPITVIAKGAIPGAMVGSIDANGFAIPAGQDLVVVSDSAGDAVVTIFFSAFSP